VDFSEPRILWGLAAIPALALWIAYGARRARAELERFAGPRLADELAPGHSWRKNLLKGFLVSAGFALLVVALAGPRFGSQLVKVDREGIDVVVALDTSLSMLAEDMLPNRLERAKQAVVDLINGLRGDRIGIVVFAGDAYALCPLTVDYDAALMFTRTIDVDMVSEPGTALEKAIRTSAALFEESTKRDRAIILLTDGENQEGDPQGAAAEAGSKGIRIFTIGIGNPAGELIPERGTGGTVEGYKKDKRGQTVLTRLDEKTLQEIAAASDGKYLPATREGLELKVLYGEISGMQRKAIKGEFVEKRKERFWIFLAGALGALLADSLTTSRATGLRRRRRSFLHTGVGAAVLVAVILAPMAAGARSVDRKRVLAGNEYYRATEYDKALALYREALGDTVRPPKNAQGVFYNQGNALYMQEKYKEAVDMYQRSYSPDSMLTGRMLYNRANALQQSGQLKAAVESYVQALQYAPDDPAARHNLEVALRKLRQQQQQQEQQQQQNSGDKDKNDQENQGDQNNENQKGGQDEQRKQDEQGGEDQQQKDQQREGEQQQQQPQADSTQASEPPQADSTAVAQPQLTPEDMKKLSKEDAMRILQALEEQEKKLQVERRKAAFRRLKRSGKDW